MVTMEMTYWNGKETKDSKELSNKMVSIGYTENEVFNAYISLTKIYYDCYNNGGCNLDYDDYSNQSYLYELVERILNADIGIQFGEINLEEDVEELLEKLLTEDEDGDYIHLELLMDLAIKEICKKNTDFKKYSVWQNYDRQLLSYSEKNDKNWSEVSFGNQNDFESWTSHREKEWKFKVVR